MSTKVVLEDEGNRPTRIEVTVNEDLLEDEVRDLKDRLEFWVTGYELQVRSVEHVEEAA